MKVTATIVTVVPPSDVSSRCSMTNVQLAAVAAAAQQASTTTGGAKWVFKNL